MPKIAHAQAHDRRVRHGQAWGGRLHLTPDSLENAYEYLRTTLPFRRMNLPHADNLVFRVMGARDRFGHFRGRIKSMPEFNEIGVSIRVVKSTDLLMATMAHEMIHLYPARKWQLHPRSPQYGIRAHGRTRLPHSRFRPRSF